MGVATQGSDALWRRDSISRDIENPVDHDAGHQIALPWVVRLRSGMIVGELALIAGAHFGFGLNLPITGLLAAIALQASTNWLLRATVPRRPNLGHIVGGLFALDTVCLTLILALTGGPTNPFSLLYLVQITFSALILHRAWTWTIGGLSTICFGLLFWVSTDVPALRMPVTTGEFSLHLLGMWLAFATAALLISFFIGRVTDEGRRTHRELLQMQQRLAKNERLASLVTLSAGAAHEIATPLATIAVAAREIERQAHSESRDSQVAEDAELIRSQVERCRLILERMGARGADPFGESPRQVTLDELLRRVREANASDSHRIEIGPTGRLAASCHVPVRPTVEALSALVRNALDASGQGQSVTLDLERDDGFVRFVVTDHGTGMSTEVMDRVAEPFFTTKPVGSGMGLGGFLAYIFAQQCGGHLSFESEPGHGSRVVLALPVKSDA